MSNSKKTSSNGGRVFLTGGSGHLGANLVRALLDRGEAVRALVHPDHDNRGLDGLDIERVEGDLRDAEGISRAVKGCDRVFHTAAKISTITANPQEKRNLYDINVLGTRNVLAAAREHGVDRVVFTGSFSAVGFNPERTTDPSDEQQPFYPFTRHMPYAYTKMLAEMECLRAVAEGLDVVMITSCAIMGPNDFIPSRLGRTLCTFAAGQLKAYIPGGFEFVSSTDIVNGHLLGMDKGRTGQKYIISSGFETMDDLLEIFEQVTGRKKPRRLHPKVMLPLAWAGTTFKKAFMPNAPQLLTPLAIQVLQTQRHADTSRAREELGFEPTPLKDAVAAQYQFFQEHNMVERH